jgi:hypothetical protein
MKITRYRKVRPLAEKQTIGMTDVVDFPDLNLPDIQAKIDTGAYTSALHCKDVRLEQIGELRQLHFCVVGLPGEVERVSVSDEFSRRLVRNSFGVSELRYVIKTRIKLFGRVFRAEFTLADRERMRYPVLLGRRLLRGRFLVDVSKKNLSFTQKKDRRSSRRGSSLT